MNQLNQTHQERFTSPQMKRAYGTLLNNAFNNYNSANDLADSLYKDYQSGKSIGDDQYFKQGWNQWQGLDTNNLQKINSGSYNPNDNADWVSANNDIDANARRGWGKTLNQVNQNMIASGMANGSGHQTAAYQTAAGLNSQLAADRASRWQQQYNQNIQNTLAANGQLENFYSTLSNIGLDYAKLSQQDLSTLLSAYNAQKDALKTWGNAVEMGSDPTVTTENRQKQWGTQNTQSNTNSKTSEGFGGIFGTVAGVMPWGKMFG